MSKMRKLRRKQRVKLGQRVFRYTVVIERESDPKFEGYYNAYVPALPGCVSYGKSEQEALANIREAIASYLLSILDEGESPPQDISPEIKTVTIEVSV